MGLGQVLDLCLCVPLFRPNSPQTLRPVRQMPFACWARLTTLQRIQVTLQDRRAKIGVIGPQTRDTSRMRRAGFEEIQ